MVEIAHNKGLVSKVVIVNLIGHCPFLLDFFNGLSLKMIEFSQAVMVFRSRVPRSEDLPAEASMSSILSLRVNESLERKFGFIN